MTTTASRQNPYGLLVALDKNGAAQGELCILSPPRLLFLLLLLVYCILICCIYFVFYLFVFYCILFYCILFYCILFYFILLHFILFYCILFYCIICLFYCILFIAFYFMLLFIHIFYKGILFDQNADIDDGEELDPITSSALISYTAAPSGVGGSVTATVVSSTYLGKKKGGKENDIYCP
jgi:hypothetical protein